MLRAEARRRKGTDPDELLTRAANGDEAAFGEFYDLAIGKIFGLIRSVLRDPARSEEVTQEVMLELWRTAPRYSSQRGSAMSWALTMAHRRAVDCVRSEESLRSREQKVSSGERVETSPDPAVLTEDSLERGRVSRAMEQLTPTQRESIELAFFSGYSHSEVAATLDLPLGTVKTRIRDGLIRLRDGLEVSR